MYPVENVYSKKAHEAWCRREQERSNLDLKRFRQNWLGVARGPFWEVKNWDELRSAVSFLTLMNKRQVLYFRGQTNHYSKCLPKLFRKTWQLGDKSFELSKANRGRYHQLLPELSKFVVKTAKEVGTPRIYILERVPGAAAAVLQHYLLWPTQFADITRSLPTALAFAGKEYQKEGYLYVFAMPDLRGSITSDMDQHLTLSRLEAICPPGAKRPHHQDAYTVARFPEPVGLAGPGHPSWDDWERRSDLMQRLVAKFRLTLSRGHLQKAPRVDLEFLVPPLKSDPFGRLLHKNLFPIAERRATELCRLVPSAQAVSETF